MSCYESRQLISRLGSQDLYNYQMALQELDGMRVDGKFRDSEGNVPEGQLVSVCLAFLAFLAHN